MTDRTTGLRYLSALFQISREREIVGDVKDVLTAFSAALEQSLETREFLLNPMVRADQKKAVLLTLLEGASPLVRDFVCLLVDKGREGVLLYAGEEFDNLYREANNMLVAKVQAAGDLDDSFRDDLSKQLASATGKKVQLVEEKIKELLGGVRVVFGSRMIDASLKGRLERMRRALKGGSA